MKGADLLKAMTDIDDRLIEEAAPSSLVKKERRPVFAHWYQYAGVFAVVLFAIVLGRNISQNSVSEQPDLAAYGPVETETLQEAEEICGFTFEVPESVQGLSQSLYTVIDQTEIEVDYGSDHQLRLSKAKGTDDISGDYESYESTPDIVIDQDTVHMRVNDGKVYSAWWTSGSYSYSIYSSGGISQEETSALVKQMN